MGAVEPGHTAVANPSSDHREPAVDSRIYAQAAPLAGMHLVDRPWPDAEAAAADVAILPVGSTEQHGPHAPLGTDTFAAGAIASEGARRADEEVVLAPPIPVGVAAEHRHFAGTLWVSEDTFRDYVGETIESLAHHGWDRVVVVNGHGGNVAPLREVCGRLSRAGDLYAVPFTWFDAIDTEEVEANGKVDAEGDAATRTEDRETPQMGHGGPLETSLLRHIQPDLVDEDAFAAAAADGAARWGDWQAGVNLAYDTADFSDSGVVGDPADSSAALGEALLGVAAERLADLVTVVADRE